MNLDELYNYDRNRLYTLENLKEVAPDIKLNDAMKLAGDIGVLKTENYTLKCALAILAEPLGFDKEAHLPDNLKNAEPAIAWALKMVQNNHAWVVCSPVSNSLEKLKKEIEEEKWK